MNLKVQAVKNIGSNWFGVALTFIVGFFLSPFILHKLGDDAFGLWILIFSLTGYYGIFDFGIRSSIVKYVAEFRATGDRDRLIRIVNFSILFYGCIAFALLLLVLVGSSYVNSIFHISPRLQQVAKPLLLLVGATTALGFPLSVFAGVLEGLQKFYFINLIQGAATVLRAVLIVLALDHGLGLLSIALITTAFPLLSYLVYGWKVMQLIPLQFGARFIDGAISKQMCNYSFFSFISMTAWRLRFQTDAVIIGAMLSSSAITYFSIASKLVGYSSLLVGGVAQIFTPMSSEFAALGDHERLRRLFVLGNRACALTVFPISAMLFVLGKSVIDVWVGPKYEPSYQILVILLIPGVLFDIQGSSRQILYGMGRHQLLAVVNVVEGVVNVILSVVLIRYWGIIGDAFGTAIPLTLTSLFFQPPYLCRLLKVKLRDFVSQAYLLPLALCAPFVATLILMQHFFHPRTYMQLAAEVAVGMSVYNVGIFWLFFIREPVDLKANLTFKRYVLQAFGR